MKTKKLILTVVFILLGSILLSTAASNWSSVAVLTEITGKVVRPGDSVEFAITLEKGYNVSESASVTLSLKSKPEGWKAGFFVDNDQITQITFPENKNTLKHVILRVKTPFNASSKTYSIIAIFKPDEGDTIYREFVVTVDRNADTNIDMYSNILGRKTHPGYPVKFTVTIENKYDHRATVKLFVVTKPIGWGVNLVYEGVSITKLSLPANSKENFEVEVLSPIDASIGEHEVIIGAKLDNGEKILSQLLSVTINPYIEKNQSLSAYLGMHASISGMETRPEDPVEFTVTLESKYDQEINCYLKAFDMPKGWKVEFLSTEDSEVRITTLSIPAKDKQSFKVKVVPSINASDGGYQVTIGAGLEDGRRVSQKLGVTINKGLEQSQMLKIYPSSSEITLNPGGSMEIRVNLKNTGDKTLNKVQLEVQEVSGINTVVRSFGSIDQLEPSEVRSIPVEIRARADAGSGKKEILMRATSEEAQSEDESVKVIVVKSESSGFIGILLVVLAIIALIIIIYKFGRR